MTPKAGTFNLAQPAQRAHNSHKLRLACSTCTAQVPPPRAQPANCTHRGPHAPVLDRPQLLDL
ncbi:hypothetical protein M440DRAFT_1403910 [Trichoderma longibrachiatum ATCC 18648]|uniref:Uncharacterized protein n=1 Tax=Trichoderma longibrachiatum ATCC 18648 TaxID=983965 RepID=A0A2T4BWL3_TRILO|nr:hypothetical protein M440DRAFT_1403910 [Trichoderma longibrachiatum ATCC 18648]